METDTKKVKQTLKRVRKTLSWSAMSKSARAAMSKSKSIDHQLEVEKEKKEREILILVLGGAFSGKSTFVKQLRFHFGDGFPETEREKYKPQVFDNVSAAAGKIIDNMRLLGVEFENEAFKKEAEDFQKRNPVLNFKALLSQVPDAEDIDNSQKGANSLISMACSELTKRFTVLSLKCNGLSLSDQKLLQQFWADKGFQDCFEQRNKFTEDKVLTAQEIYFLNDLNRIMTEQYLPTMQDILFIRRPTLGVVEHLFHIDGSVFRVIDVAGQKSQRKKWIHLFENVTVALFFVALNGFDEMLEEDETLTRSVRTRLAFRMTRRSLRFKNGTLLCTCTYVQSENSLEDSLQTFREVSHNKYLEKTDFILFLNKHDLFVEKLKTTELKRYRHDYKGDNNPEDCVKFIRDLFHQHRPCHKQVHTHVSCATDINMMQDILGNVLDIVAEINLRKSSAAF